MQLTTVIEDYTSDLNKKKMSQNTVSSYRRELKLFQEWYIQTDDTEPLVNQIGPFALSQYKRFKLEKNLNAGKIDASGKQLPPRFPKPNTINHAITTFNQFFQWCIDRKLIDYNPARDIEFIEEIFAPAPRWLKREEAFALIRAAEKRGKIRDVAMVTVFLHTGLRVSEMCQLRREDITLSERSGALNVREGKGGVYRRVPLNKDARRALERYIEQERGDDSGVMFPSRKAGGHLLPRAIQKLMVRLSYDARIAPSVTPHMLRHTFAKTLIDEKESLDKVALLLGHRSINTTKRYTLPSERDLEDSVSKLEWR